MAPFNGASCILVYPNNYEAVFVGCPGLLLTYQFPYHQVKVGQVIGNVLQVYDSNRVGKIKVLMHVK